ncbi:hypothetical protein OMY_00996 [Enterococcus sulfureus ATCC 49903]|uniref:CAP-Gly protein n=1 Tax=Enterococcus sulfureus ATCC 49903 TaxID=1140003 RepID=S0NR51_9ENTE|nr:hypothetical protein [Enterococcus sulfureus]EOT47622.1 hypothetical protein OMY_00996 [Enterococcus sulfureus ATCC 49903]EOT83957.1 hypothetical protein I573_01682 [Enterococcus sulfureus ATCC 49903]
MEHKRNEYFTPNEAGINISWGSVVAGVISFFAIFMTFGLIGSAIGFGAVDPTAKDPFDGVGTGLLIWTIVTLVVSLGLAGFISGVAARKVGWMHGFLTWATSMMVVTLIVSFTAITTLSAVGSLLGNVTSTVTDGASSVASATGDAISKSFDTVTKEVGSVNTDDLQANVTKYLQDTDVAELQPDYLKNQLSEATDEITNAGKEIVKNPDDADKIIDTTADSLQEKAKKIGDSVDRDAIANAVSKNTELSEEEAQQATDTIYNQLQTASSEAQKQLDMARENVDQLKSEIKDTVEEAKQTADDVSDTTAKASIWGFVAMILGLIITSIAGMFGASLARPRD